MLVNFTDGSDLPAGLNLHRCCPAKLQHVAYMQFDRADLGQQPDKRQMRMLISPFTLVIGQAGYHPHFAARGMKHKAEK